MSPYEKLTVQIAVVGLLLAALSVLAAVFAAEFRDFLVATWAWIKRLRQWRPKINRRRLVVVVIAAALGVAVFLVVQGLPVPASTATPKVHPSSPIAASALQTMQQGPPLKVIKGVKFVLIPAGEASIGCTLDDEQCARNELPLHSMSIPKPLWMAVTETTIAQYESCVHQRHCSSPAGEPLVQHAGAEKLPITWVAAEDAQRFCQWLGGDLPLETEWEYAARGRLHNCRYPWGKSVSPREARYRTGVAPGVAAVGSFSPNDYGLYDMAGNVSEFCLGPMSSNGKPFVMLRGGSYETGSDRLRVSARTLTDWGFAGAAIGFRCVVRQ